ncbi:MAG TPA: glycoside hydrolase family 97 protein [bacterium]|nr:glycoside hydrolase family 97 protein [bacterium]
MIRFKSFTVFTIVLCSLLWGKLPGETYSLSSPDEQVEVQIETGDQLGYAVHYQGDKIIDTSPISLTLRNGKVLGANTSLNETDTRSVNETITPVVPVKQREIPNHFNERILRFDGEYSVIFRAYNDGVAYRFVTEMDGEITVAFEQASFRFTRDHPIYVPVTDSYLTHQEENYTYGPLSKVTHDSLCFPPVLVRPRNGPNILITEAHLEDYPGMYLTRDRLDSLKLTGIFPAYPLTESEEGPRTVRVTERADYLATTTGERAFPWRVIAVAPDDGDLLTNEIVFRLAKPLQLKKPGWIRPGKVAWDWWNDRNEFGVDFKSGVNTATYKYYIDFAAHNNLEYVIFDSGWSEASDLFAINPNVDMETLTAYAREHDVGIVLWCAWVTLGRQLDRAMDQFAQWDIKGIKVDFMQRDDQKVVNYYWRIAREAAEHHLLVDFHGAYKPSGLRRAYPNVLTREGVKGLEQSKWSYQPTPEYNVQLPFIRMFAGPMDFTPGATINAQEANFRPINDKPMSLGTRAHQMAMYVVFESPLQMLSDSPSHYKREPEMMRFLSHVPTTWDETVVLDAQVSDYVALARQSGDEWYVGAMTDWNSRTVHIDLSFLGAGTYTAEVYADGVNADHYGSDYTMETIRVNQRQTLEAQLAPGGGWAARIYKE